MRRFLVGAAVVLALAATLPALIKVEYYYVLGFTILQFIIMATAWNILGGFAGYVNFGSGAFFAVGASSRPLFFRTLKMYCVTWQTMAAPAV